jgi:hypothetical protein
MYPRNMVYFRHVIVNTLHNGDNKDDDDDDDDTYLLHGAESFLRS